MKNIVINIFIFLSLSSFALQINKKDAGAMLEVLYKDGKITKAQYEKSLKEMTAMDTNSWKKLNEQAADIIKNKMNSNTTSNNNQNLEEIQKKVNEAMKKLESMK